VGRSSGNSRTISTVDLHFLQLLVDFWLFYKGFFLLYLNLEIIKVLFKDFHTHGFFRAVRDFLE
jgi:hypothetical protein